MGNLLNVGECCIANKHIAVLIEIDLFRRESNFWANVFVLHSNEEHNESELVIKEDLLVSDVCREGNCFRCNTGSSQWKYWFLYELELFLYSEVRATVIHSSGVRCFGHDFLFIGKSMSGKSTLTFELCTQYGGKYLDDDCVFVSHCRCIGYGFPAAVRKKVQHNEKSFSFVGTTDDAMTKDRSLISYYNKVNTFDRNVTIVFVHYQPESKATLRKMQEAETTRHILLSLKYRTSLAEAYHDIGNLVSRSKAYEIVYPSTISAIRLIEQISEGDKNV